MVSGVLSTFLVVEKQSALKEAWELSDPSSLCSYGRYLRLKRKNIVELKALEP